MLIISRRKGERIAIGNDVEVVVTDVTRKGVRLAIVAPPSTLILRGEVRDAVEEANRSALGSDLAIAELPEGKGSQGAGVMKMAVRGVKVETSSVVDGAKEASQEETASGAAAYFEVP